MCANYIKRLHVERLKGISNLDISFSRGLTCLIGPNGVGKSTILHALCCAYRKKDERYAEHRISEYLTPYQNQLWQGNSFTAYFGNEENEQAVTYEKRTDRWIPRQERKMQRTVVYVGLETCTPAIERENRRCRIRLTKTKIPETIEKKILTYMSQIMERNYKSCFIYKDAGKEYFGISEQTSEDDKPREYCSLSMSAGEQRCLLILKTLIEAPGNALILIEELDVLIHEGALKRLVSVMNDIIRTKPLQIVFSSHNSSIANVENVAFRCLQKNPAGDVDCFDGFFTYDMYNLRGQRDVKMTIFVEDKLSERIVRKVCESLGVVRMVQIKVFGAIENAFTLASGLAIQEANKNVLIVLDGDRHRSAQEKLDRMQAVLTGRGDAVIARREKALAYLNQYDLPDGFSPERYIVKIVKDRLPHQGELQQVLLSAEASSDGHLIFRKAADRLGENVEDFSLKVIDKIAESEEFKKLVKPIQEVIQHRLSPC